MLKTSWKYLHALTAVLSQRLCSLLASYKLVSSTTSPLSRSHVFAPQRLPADAGFYLFVIAGTPTSTIRLGRIVVYCKNQAKTCCACLFGRVTRCCVLLIRALKSQSVVCLHVSVWVCLYLFTFVCECLCECLRGCLCECLCECSFCVQSQISVCVCVYISACLCVFISMCLCAHLIQPARRLMLFWSPHPTSQG